MKLQQENGKEKQITLQSITNPQKVKILILTQQKISFQDFYFIKPFQNLIKLDLSYNKISNFPNGFTFKNNLNLRILFLHYNKLQKLKSISVLAQSSSIIYLTLFGNPLEETITRHFCVNTMQKLMLMDDKVVGQQQRFQGMLNILDKKRNVGFPLIDNIEEKSSIQFLANVLKQINFVRKYYVKFNPIIKIQRWIRKIIKTKENYKKYLNAHIIDNQSNNQFEAQTRQTIKQQLQHQIISKTKNQNQNFKQQHKKQLMIYGVIKGWHSFKLFLLQRLKFQRIFASIQWCEKNNVNYLKSPYLNKEIITYRVPTQRKSYYKQKQLLKNRLQLLFYNNNNYLLQLKKIRNDSILSIKTIYDKNCIVEIKASIEDKIKHLTLIFFKRHQSEQSFPILFQFSLLRVSSAVKIQKIWRGFSQRKKHDCLKYLKQKRAAIKIQKWIRNLKFTHRKNFLISFRQYIKFSDSNFITISLQDFYSLGSKEIQIQKTSKLNFCLPFSRCKFQVRPRNNPSENQQSQNLLNFTQKKQKNCQYQVGISSSLNPFPQYFSSLIDPFVLDQNSKNEPNYSTLFDLLLKGAFKIQRYKIKNLQYSRFYYNSVTQTNARKAMLALKTYDFRQKNWLKQALIESTFPTQVRNIYQSLHEGAFLKMVYDNKDQNVLLNLKQVVKEIQKKSNVKWNPIKVRYFQGKTDYSCIILAGSYKTTENLHVNNETDKNYNSASPTKRQNSNNDKQSISNNKSQQSLHKSYISRNVISLSNEIQYQSPRYKNCSTQKNIDSLKSEQSKISLSSGIIDFKNYGKTQPLRKQEAYNNQLISLKQKKQHIQNQNKEHRYRLQMIQQIKNKNNQQISISHKQSQILNKKIVVQNSNSLLLQKIRKVQKVKQLQKEKVSSRYKEKFQLSFLKNGNTSNRHKMKLFQKDRAISGKKEQIHLKYRSQCDKSQIFRQGKKNKHYLSQRRQILKTQIKQFSIQFSEGDMSFSQNPVENYQVLQQVLKKKPEKYNKEQEEDQTQQQNKQIINRRYQQNQRKKKESKKKRLVHSVFPQEFYPLKESKDLGFHLPRLQRKN